MQPPRDREHAHQELLGELGRVAREVLRREVGRHRRLGEVGATEQGRYVAEELVDEQVDGASQGPRGLPSRTAGYRQLAGTYFTSCPGGRITMEDEIAGVPAYGHDGGQQSRSAGYQVPWNRNIHRVCSAGPWNIALDSSRPP
jgi:hypothetical protein